MATIKNLLVELLTSQTNLKRNNLLIPHAIEFHHRLFFLMSTWDPVPIEWDSTNKEIQERGNMSLRYSLACFNIFCVCWVAGIGSSIYVLLSAPQDNTLPMAFVGIMFLWIASATFMGLVVAELWIHCMDFATGINSLKELKSRLDWIGETRHQIRSMDGGETKIVQFRTQTFWKFACVMCLSACSFFAVASIFIIACNMFFNMDPFWYVFGKIAIAYPSLELVFPPVRVAITCICSFEACRFFSFALTLAMYLAELHCKCLQKLSSLSKYNHRKFLHWYNIYTIVDKETSEVVGSIMAILIGNGIALFVVLNVTTIKFFGNVPLTLYWIFPVAAFFLFLFGFTVMSFVVEVYLKSSEMIRLARITYGRKCSGNSNGSVSWWREIAETRRVYQYLKAKKIQCGSFYGLVKGADADFFYYTTIRTADVLLLSR